VKKRPQPVCHISEFAESSVNYILRFWIDDPQNGVTNVRGDVLLAVWDAFKAADIHFAYPRREVVFRNPVEVRGADLQGGKGEPSPPG
jgi:small-conductance mechanosensitive channel